VAQAGRRHGRGERSARRARNRQGDAGGAGAGGRSATEILLDTDAEAAPGAVLGRISTDSEQPTTARLDPVEGRSSTSAPKDKRQAFDKLRPNGDGETRFSPSVRRALQQHGIDPGRIKGTGRGGRITREDVDRAVAEATMTKVGDATTAQPRHFEGADIPHDRMRLKIAENMARGFRAPHVTAVFEADFSAVAAHKAAMADRGAKLSYTAYIVKAAAEAMAAAPAINGRWEKDRIAISPTIDIGVGTALGEKGLIVPVVKDAGSLTLEQIGQEARRPHATRPRREAHRRRRFGRELHHLQPRRFGIATRRSDHPSPGPGGDPRHRQAGKKGRGSRDQRPGRDPRPPDGLCDADHRPSRGRRAPDQRLADPFRRDPGELAAGLTGPAGTARTEQGKIDSAFLISHHASLKQGPEMYKALAEPVPARSFPIRNSLAARSAFRPMTVAGAPLG
jgi:hypothetical protein